MRFSFPRSHAFPGGRVVADDDGAPEGAGAVEFGDGVIVMASWRRQDDALLLDVPNYRTARGAEVAARRWRVGRGKDGVWRSRRIG